MARMRSASQFSFGLEDRNFLGTGRAVALTREMTLRGNGAALSVSDPFLFGGSVAGSFRLANLAGGHTLRLGLRQHEYSVFDTWHSEANLSRLSFGDTLVGERALHTINAMVLFGRRVDDDPSSVTRVLAGAEFDSAARISATSREGIAPGMPHVRSFAGLDLGLQRHAAQFDTATWIVPGRGFLDVPIGWEGEGIVGGGYERDARTMALKLDGWMGRVFMPNRGQILMLDGWESGYVGHGVDRNQIVRGSASWYASAPGGMWGAQVTAEELRELDPDRRSLSLMSIADYTSPVLHEYALRAENAVTASIGREFRVLQAGSSSVVNAGAFAAGSYRWNVDNLDGENLSVAVVGARFRILSANGTIGSTRLDIGYPVLASAALPRRPFLTITYGGLFEASRQRDGRRIY